MTDKHKAEASPEIGFRCPACKEWCRGYDDTLERGEDIDDCVADSDRLDCDHCGEEILVYRFI